MASKVRRYRVIEERGPILVLEEQDYVAPISGINLQNNGSLTGVMDTLNVKPSTTPSNAIVWQTSVGAGVGSITPILTETALQGFFSTQTYSGGTSAFIDRTAAFHMIDTTTTWTLTLPSYATAGTIARVQSKFLIIKDSTGNAAVNNITINAAAGDDIDGAASVVINANHGVVRLFAMRIGTSTNFSWLTW